MFMLRVSHAPRERSEDWSVEPIEYLRILRRRWPVVVVLTLFGLAIGYATARPASAAVHHPVATYQATAILGFPSATPDPSGLSLDAMAFFATHRTGARHDGEGARRPLRRQGHPEPRAGELRGRPQFARGLRHRTKSQSRGPWLRTPSATSSSLSSTVSCSPASITISPRIAASSTDSPRSSRH